MRRVTLTEYATATGVSLGADELSSLRRAYPTLRMEPTLGAPGRFDLTPNHRIGVVQLNDLTLEIRPKTPMSSVVFLVSYAAERVHWADVVTEWEDDATLVDLMAAVLSRSVERTTRRGLLSGYRAQEESLSAMRGRFLIPQQIRRRLGVAPPIEVEHDLFTSDIVENRILLSALCCLRRLPLRSASIRREIVRASRLFGGVELVHYPRHHVPDPAITQLNQHYSPSLQIARLVLQSLSVDVGAGARRGTAFLVDMNAVFEAFVRTAMRESLGVTRSRFPDRAPRLRLDVAERIPLKPDLCVLTDGVISWVGDAKYKRLNPTGYQNGDIYQMLAYLTATGLSSGLLVYAADQRQGVSSIKHVIKGTGVTVGIRTLDLDSPPSAILQQVGNLAEDVGEIVNLTSPKHT